MYPKKLSKQDYDKLKKVYQKLEHNTRYYAGFPPNTKFDYSELFHFLHFSMNNLGDPFYGQNTSSTHAIEQEVISFFADILGAPKGFSGYVTNGSTEGNLYGLYLARENLDNPIAIYSAHSHYSIPKCLHILNIPSIKIECQKNGEIDYQAVHKALQKNKKRHIIVVANIGTIMLGAIDNLTTIKKLLKEAKISQYHIHADAAFAGMVLPFVKHPQPFSFSDGVDSITISGHKVIGSPIPCGIALTKKRFIHAIQKKVQYVEKMDVTISGSRNGVTPLFLWYAIKRYGKTGFKKLIDDGLKKADYIIDLFNTHNFEAWHHKNSLVVVTKQFSKNVRSKWRVPTSYGFSHLTALPKLTYAMIDNIYRDLLLDRQKKLKVKKSEKLIF